jgi:type III secretory pathway lipoprotein EscJ
VTLLRGLSREQAHDAVSTLDRSGVVGHVAEDDRAGSHLRIDVDDNSVAAGVAALIASRNRGLCPAEKDTAAASSWIETPGEERTRAAEHLASRLERSLSRVPGVVEAHVHISLPFGMRSLPETQTPPAASVLLVREHGAPALGSAATELVAGAIPGLSPSAVRVVESTLQPMAAATPQLARIGPVMVTRDSASTLKAWLAASLLLHIFLAAALLRPLVRRRARAPGSDTLDGPNAPAEKPPATDS